jgi:peptide/nickel transport system substrate-binding protein
VAAIESGRVDMAQNNDIEYFEVPRLRALPHLQFFTKGNESISPIAWLDVNLRLPKFQDRRVRKALLHAIDRDFIVENLFFGLGRVANGPIASTTKFHDDKALVKYPYDPKRAAALLDEAGLRPDARGIRMRVNLLALPYGEVWTRQAEYIKECFGQVGVETTLETTDAGGFLQRNANWEFELCFNFLSQFMEPAIGVARSYVSSNIRKGVISTNVQGYSNPRIDEIFAQAAVATSASEAQKLYSEAQRIISDDLPVLYLTELQFPIFLKKGFRDVVIDATGPLGEFDAAWKE